MDTAALITEAVPKALVYLGAVLATGTIALRALVERVSPRGAADARAEDARAPRGAGARPLTPPGAAPGTALGPELRGLVTAALAGVLVRAGALLVIALAARLAAHTYVAFGPDEAWTREALALIGLESRWGEAWQRQLGAGASVLAVAFVLLGAAGRAGGGRAAPWLAAAAPVGAVAVTLPLLGHGAARVGTLLLHTAHVLAAGAWLGALLALLLVARRVRRAYGVTAHARLLSALLPAFSPLALGAAAIVAASGGAAAVLYVPSPDALVATGYGRALLVKLALVSVAAGCGFLNWRALGAGQMPRPGVMRLEALAALAIIVASAVLTETESP